jgi:hypothetical protein
VQWPLAQALRVSPFAVEATTTILHSFRFLARVFAVGSFVIVFSVAGSLLWGELAKAWVAEIRRIVRRDAAGNKSY